MKIECENIIITEEGVHEYEGSRVLVFISRAAINKVSFDFVSSTRWPLVAALIGLIFVSAGVIFGVLPLINSIITGENANFPNLKGYAFISLNIIPGIYFFMLGCLKRNCLILDTNKGIPPVSA
jgi:hypothetical protein